MFRSNGLIDPLAARSKAAPPTAVSLDSEIPPWTVRVQGSADYGVPPLMVEGEDLLPLVARLVADARIQDIVVRPRIREVRAHVAKPASSREER